MSSGSDPQISGRDLGTDRVSSQFWDETSFLAVGVGHTALLVSPPLLLAKQAPHTCKSAGKEPGAFPSLGTLGSSWEGSCGEGRGRC